jgi:hypothetical protein
LIAAPAAGKQLQAVGSVRLQCQQTSHGSQQ